MRISAKAEYACVAMIELAAMHKEPQPVRIKAIADAQGIPARFLVQILLQLKVHELVRSTRGAAGGYQLAQRPEAISLADIIHAIDQPAPPASPVLAGLHPSPAVQALGSVLHDLDAREKQMLREISLADLLRRAEQSGVSSYQI